MFHCYFCVIVCMQHGMLLFKRKEKKKFRLSSPFQANPIGCQSNILFENCNSFSIHYLERGEEKKDGLSGWVIEILTCQGFISLRGMNYFLNLTQFFLSKSSSHNNGSGIGSIELGAWIARYPYSLRIDHLICHKA